MTVIVNGRDENRATVTFNDMEIGTLYESVISPGWYYTKGILQESFDKKPKPVLICLYGPNSISNPCIISEPLGHVKYFKCYENKSITFKN